MESREPQLFCVGTNHKSAGLDYRESLFLSDESISMAIPKVIEKYKLSEVLVLSTCNRIEIYCVSFDPNTKDQLKDLFIDLQLFAKAESERDDSISSILYELSHKDCAEHAFSVTSGLDSLVLGETQITGQFKKATRHAEENGTLGPVLKRLTQEAFSASKKVRTQTDIGKKPVSISHAAIDLANRLYGQISDHNVLIIGAGEMSSVAAKYAAKYSPKSLTVINRTLSNAEDVIDDLDDGSGMVEVWENLELALLNANIVISSTSAPGFIISKEIIERVRSKRTSGLFLIDIALPRDIDPECNQVDDIYLFDIDDLKQVVGANFEERKKAASEGLMLVHKSAENYIDWLSSLRVKPAIKDFKSYIDDLLSQELKKTLQKSTDGSFSEKQQESLGLMIQSISKKVLGDVARNLNKSSNDRDSIELANTLSTIFKKEHKDK